MRNLICVKYVHPNNCNFPRAVIEITFVMKFLLLTFILLISFVSPAQNAHFEQWQKMAGEDISLQPEYGNVEKTADQRKTDSAFVSDIIAEMKDTLAAGKKMTELGFQYLYERGDPVSAMRRFNQAYLLNPDNADVYYGYGTVYFNLGAMEEARKQYDQGLKLNPEHAAMLTDYGTTYLGEYYQNFDENRTLAEERLDKALEYFERSNEIDDTNADTWFKLSIVSLYKDNCRNAKRYLKQAKKYDHPNTGDFEEQLKVSCK